MRATSSMAACASVIARLVDVVAVDTASMFAAIRPAESAASTTLRFISVVVAVCSSTAAAIVLCESLISPMIEEISPMARTAPSVSAWIASTRAVMSWVAFAVSWASSLTSLATTAKPLPASPARAA